jgi:hypothetical protein
VAAILGVPERTIRERWRDWGLTAYRIGKHLRLQVISLTCNNCHVNQ